MDWFNNIDKVIEYIEKNIEDEINYDVLNKMFCCSSYEFSRMFSLIVGIPLSEYIRKRRLSKAVLEIQNSDNKIIDIALKYGYKSQAAFSRAFKELYRMTPLAARQFDGTLKPFPKIFLKLKERKEMQPNVIRKDEFYLSGFLVKNEGGNFWYKYEHETTIHKDGPELVNWAGYEVHFYTADGEYIFTGCQQKENVLTSHYEKLVLPSTLWAIFEIDQKIDQNPQFEGVNAWLEENKDLYKGASWNNKDKLDGTPFTICLYEHQGKFGSESIMEMWIPLEKLCN